MSEGFRFFGLLLIFTGFSVQGINERNTKNGIFPWSVKIRSFYDKEIRKAHPNGDWFLNLGPTGIRAKLTKENPKAFSVQYVFQDKNSAAKGKVSAGDIIIGANGKKFSKAHKFGKTGGWDGPLMELAQQIEKSQAGNGILTLMVHPQGKTGQTKKVDLQLRKRLPFAKSFPYDCPRSKKMIEELCDFLVMDYKSDHWKQPNEFYGGTHGKYQQLLALMASGLDKYQPILDAERKKFYGKKYAPSDGGFCTWAWGYEAIVMAEFYALTKDAKLIKPMQSVAKAMPWGSFNENGFYTHRPHIAIRRAGKKPYASIASISGLQMLGMSLFKEQKLQYDKKLYETIHQNFLRAAQPDSLAVSYALPNSDVGSNGRDRRHAVIKLADPSKGRSGKGVGYLCPTGMKGIGKYEIVWPTKSDWRYKPTDWIAKEANENTVEELTGNLRRVDRYLGEPKKVKEPTRPYGTKTGGRFHAPVALGALAHLLGNNPRSWQYLGAHGANSVALTPDKSFDGHAANTVHAFWSVLAAARSDQAKAKKDYYDYMKSFLVLSECHDGGLYLQPWGRDPKNNDPGYAPRALPTSIGIMILALDKQKLYITGKGMPRLKQAN